jgi:hypothetical protein
MTTCPSTSVTVEKEHEGVLSTVTIDLSVSGSEFGIYIRDYLITRDLDPLPECAALYPSAEQLYRACLAGASEGIINTSRDFRDSCGRVTYTRLSGTRLPVTCATGFAVAASLALLRALNRPEQLTRSMDGWRIVT